MAYIKERLDHGVANHAWRALFPKAEITVSTIVFSDHTPLFLSLRPIDTRQRPKAQLLYEAG
jgi:hypothetical protein